MEQDINTKEARFSQFRFGLFDRFRRISGIHNTLRESHYDDLIQDCYEARKKLRLWSEDLPWDHEDQYIIVGYEDELDKVERSIRRSRDDFIDLENSHRVFEKAKAKHPEEQQFFDVEPRIDKNPD